MLRKVHLYDELKAQFGGPFMFDIDTPGEAIRALVANFPQTFAPAIKDGAYTLVAGLKPDDGTIITLDMLRTFQIGADDLHIMPVAGGAKSAKGIISIVLGVALLATGVLGAAGAFGAVAEGGALGLDFGATIGFAGITYGNIALMGASLLLGGISSLMTNNVDTSKTGATTASYLLNGPTNNVEQGGAVPLVFGRFRVGSTVVSTTLKAKQIAVGSQNFTTDIVNSKGDTVHPSQPPDLTLVGMVPPGIPTLQACLEWQYPYPAWPGHGSVPPTQTSGGSGTCGGFGTDPSAVGTSDPGGSCSGTGGCGGSGGGNAGCGGSGGAGTGC